MSRARILAVAGGLLLAAPVLPAAADGLGQFQELLRQAPPGVLSYRSGKPLGENGFILEGVTVKPPPEATEGIKTEEPIQIDRIAVEQIVDAEGQRVIAVAGFEPIAAGQVERQIVVDLARDHLHEQALGLTGLVVHEQRQAVGGAVDEEDACPVLVDGGIAQRRSIEIGATDQHRRAAEEFLGDLVARPRDLIVLPLRQHVVDAVESDDRLDGR